MTMPDRFFPTPSILNFRDYGGYATACGGQVKWGRLFRSSDHSIASDDDLALLDTLDVSAVIDLRSPQERVMRPSRRNPGRSAEVLSVPAAAAAAPHVAAMEGPSSPQMVRERLIQYYRESPFRETQKRGLQLYFETIARIDGPTLVHCAAGKDRTGIAAALLLAALGVERDHVFADYLLTNEAGSLEERASAFAYSVSHHFGHAPSDAVLRVALSVDPDYLNAAFDAITTRCGDLSRYLDDVLGIDATRFRGIASRLLA